MHAGQSRRIIKVPHPMGCTLDSLHVRSAHAVTHANMHANKETPGCRLAPLSRPSLVPSVPRCPLHVYMVRQKDWFGIVAFVGVMRMQVTRGLMI